MAIINADSLQIFKGLPILSCIPKSQENHFLYEILDPKDKITAQDWAKMAKEQIKKARSSGKIPVLVGGSAFYLKVLQSGIVNIPNVSSKISENLENYNKEEIINKLKEKDPEILIRIKDLRRLKNALGVFLETGQKLSEWWKEERIRILDEDLKIFSIVPQKEALSSKIKHRLSKMFPDVINEVANFQKNYKITSNAIGFYEINEYLERKLCLPEMEEKIFQKTMQYAKRQKTFIKNSLKIEKFFQSLEEAEKFLLAFLN